MKSNQCINSKMPRNYSFIDDMAYNQNSRKIKIVPLMDNQNGRQSNQLRLSAVLLS